MGLHVLASNDANEIPAHNNKHDARRSPTQYNSTVHSRLAHFRTAHLAADIDIAAPLRHP